MWYQCNFLIDKFLLYAPPLQEVGVAVESITMTSMYPRQELRGELDDQTLSQLHLVPSAVVLVRVSKVRGGRCVCLCILLLHLLSNYCLMIDCQYNVPLSLLRVLCPRSRVREGAVWAVVWEVWLVTSFNSSSGSSHSSKTLLRGYLEGVWHLERRPPRTASYQTSGEKGNHLYGYVIITRNKYLKQYIHIRNHPNIKCFVPLQAGGLGWAWQWEWPGGGASIKTLQTRGLSKWWR